MFDRALHEQEREPQSRSLGEEYQQLNEMFPPLESAAQKKGESKKQKT